MNYNLFSENMKLADILLANYRLLYVFPYFGIDLGFGETTVKQVCDKKGMSSTFFLLVCNVYSFDNYRPNHSILKQIREDELIAYLSKSHKDYLETRIPHIISHVLELVSCSPKKRGEMLVQFCEKYREDVTTHFKYEETFIFPYITNLLNGKKGDKHKIGLHDNTHDNLATALHDLKSIIIKYLPNNSAIEKCRTNVLIYLFLFEADLSKHSLLENKILTALEDDIDNTTR